MEGTGLIFPVGGDVVKGFSSQIYQEEALSKELLSNIKDNFSN